MFREIVNFQNYSVVVNKDTINVVSNENAIYQINDKLIFQVALVEKKISEVNGESGVVLLDEVDIKG